MYVHVEVWILACTESTTLMNWKALPLAKYRVTDCNGKPTTETFRSVTVKELANTPETFMAACAATDSHSDS